MNEHWIKLFYFSLLSVFGGTLLVAHIDMLAAIFSNCWEFILIFVFNMLFFKSLGLLYGFVIENLGNLITFWSHLF